MPVVIPYTFVGGPGRKAKASEVNADFQAIAAKFTEQAGGIADGDVYAYADLNCNKLSSTPGKRLIASKFEVGAVDASALKADATLGSAAAAVGSSAHIKDGIVGRLKLKLRTDDVVWSGGGSPNIVAAGATREASSTFNPTTEALVGFYQYVQSNSLDSPLARQLDYKIWFTKASPSSYTVHIMVKNPTAGTLSFQATPGVLFTYIQT